MDDIFTRTSVLCETELKAGMAAASPNPTRKFLRRQHGVSRGKYERICIKIEPGIKLKATVSDCDNVPLPY